MKTTISDYGSLASFLGEIGFVADELYERNDVGRMVLEAHNGKSVVIMDFDHNVCDVLNSTGIVIASKKFNNIDEAVIAASEQLIVGTMECTTIEEEYQFHVTSDNYPYWEN